MGQRPEMPAKPRPIALPRPRPRGELSLEEALARRRSVREFLSRPLTREEISQLVWAAQGITDGEGDRTAPSAGALFPLELYLTTAEGTFHYRPSGHRLRRLGKRDVRRPLCRAALSQEWVRDAPATFAIAAVYSRTVRKYGKTWSPLYVHLEAGHAAQNLLLQAVALDLGAVVVGAFDDDEVQRLLGLPPSHEPLYLIPVGEPAPVRE